MCIAHAGGQSLAFRGLAEALARAGVTAAVDAIDAPGHGWATGEPLASIDELAALYLTWIPAERLAGAVLVGHSMGGYVALALALALQERGTPARALIVGATRPPHRRADYPSLTELADDDLATALIGADGAAGSEQAALFAPNLPFMRTIRADLLAFETWTAPARLLAAPLLAVGGLEDPLCRAEHMFDWAHLAAECRVDFVAAGHLFAQTAADAYAARIVTFVRSCAQ